MPATLLLAKVDDFGPFGRDDLVRRKQPEFDCLPEPGGCFKPPSISGGHERTKISLPSPQQPIQPVKLMPRLQDVCGDRLKDVGEDRLQFVAMLARIRLEEHNVGIGDDVLRLERECHQVAKTRSRLCGRFGIWIETQIGEPG